MNSWKGPLLILMCLSQLSCAALLTEQTYVLIDRDVEVKMTFYGEIYSMPERAAVRKIVLLGSGKIQNIEIHVRDERDRWKPAKKVPGSIRFPYEIPIIVETDAIKIIKRSTTGTGHIETVQFYSVADKGN